MTRQEHLKAQQRSVRIPTLNKAGNAYSGSGKIDVYDVAGNLVFSAPFTITATRILVEKP